MTAAMLAQAVYLQGRHAEAAVLCGESERHASPEDVATQAMWRGVAAKVHATEGRHDAAEATAREAVRLVEPTDLLNDRRRRPAGPGRGAAARRARHRGRTGQRDGRSRSTSAKATSSPRREHGPWPTVTAPL